MEVSGGLNPNINEMLQKLKGESPSLKLIKNSEESLDLLRSKNKQEQKIAKSILDKLTNLEVNSHFILDNMEQDNKKISETLNNIYTVSQSKDAKIGDSNVYLELITELSTSMVSEIRKLNSDMSDGLLINAEIQEKTLGHISTLTRLSEQEAIDRKLQEDKNIKVKDAPQAKEKVKAEGGGLLAWLMGLTLAKKISNAFKALLYIPTKIAQLIMKPFQMFGNLVKSSKAFASISAFIAKIPVIGKMFQGMGKVFGVIGKMAAYIPKVLGIVGKGLRVIPGIGQVIAVVMGIVDAFTGWFNADDITGKSEELLTVGDKVAAMLSSVISGLTFGFLGDSKKMYEKLFGPKGLLSAIPKLVDKLVNFIKNDAVGLVSKFVSGMFSSIGERLSNFGSTVVGPMIEGFVSKLSSAWDTTKDIASVVGNAISDFIPKLFDLLITIAKDYSPAGLAMKGVGAIGDLVSGLFSSDDTTDAMKATDVVAARNLSPSTINADTLSKLSLEKDMASMNNGVSSQPIITNVTNNSTSNNSGRIDSLDADFQILLTGGGY
jgi:hypothetical protein